MSPLFVRKFFSKFIGTSETLQQQDQNNFLLEEEHKYFSSHATTSTNLTKNLKLWNPEFASDPTAWEKEFKHTWKILKKIIVKCANTNDIEILNKVKRLFCNMSTLLIMEINSQPEAIIGPILDHCFNEEIFNNMYEWVINMSPILMPDSEIMLLETYEDIVNRTQNHNHCLLVHKPILIPLLKLLYWCRKMAIEKKVLSNEVDKYFVRLLNQICKKIAEDSTLLEFFFNPPFTLESEIENSGNKFESEHPFLIFILLIPYMHLPNDIGQLARNALLQIMSVSREKDFVVQYVVNSTFCAILATGLSAFWSQLPRSICSALYIFDIDEFHKLNLQTDIELVEELSEFYKALLFCNAVVQNSHDDIVQHIIHYFYSGFLYRVFKAAVEQLDNEDLVSIIVYYHMCLETVTEESLIQALIKVLIVSETNDCDMNLLELILSKMNENEILCRVVLSLLKSLLELKCEDLIWNCLMRFILPFIPLKQSRRFDINISLNAAEHFLSCIPDCTQNIEELNSEETLKEYLKSAAQEIEKANFYCNNWAFSYDGVKPNTLLDISAPEEVLSTRQPFVRLSSARSSFASNGFNRYFQNRSAHETQDSMVLSDNAGNTENGIPPLNKLGEDDSFDILPSLTEKNSSMRSYDKFDNLLDSEQDDFVDSQYDLMTATDNLNLDYFHFTYESISSESDETNNSRRNSYKEEGEENNIVVTNGSKSQLTNGYCSNCDDLIDDNNFSSLTPFVQSIRLTNWKVATEDLNNFYAALDALPMPNSCNRTIDENLALIDSRYQYLNEVLSERVEMENSFNNNISSFHNDLRNNINNDNKTRTRKKTEFYLTCTDEKGSGLLLESLFSALEKVIDRSFTTNLQLIGVLNALMAYPQPVITSYLLYVDAIKSNALLRITNILETLKAKIDTYAYSTNGFEDMMRRGLRHKMIRAERFEQSNWLMSKNSVPYQKRFHSNNNSSTLINGTTSFRFTHKAMESQERVADSTRSKNFAYAAILLSQLCQLCAAYALQHKVPTLYSNGN